MQVLMKVLVQVAFTEALPVLGFETSDYQDLLTIEQFVS